MLKCFSLRLLGMMIFKMFGFLIRHVLDLKRNLISLGELDYSGCKALVEIESMRVL